MKNYLLRKTNIIRPSRSLYINPFRNDNNLKNMSKKHFAIKAADVMDATGITILVRPYMALNINGFSSFLDR